MDWMNPTAMTEGRDREEEGKSEGNETKGKKGGVEERIRDSLPSKMKKTSDSRSILETMTCIVPVEDSDVARERKRINQ